MARASATVATSAPQERMIRAASLRPSFLGSFAASRTNSTVQAKLGLQIGKLDRVFGTEVLHPLLGEIEIL